MTSKGPAASPPAPPRDLEVAMALRRIIDTRATASLAIRLRTGQVSASEADRALEYAAHKGWPDGVRLILDRHPALMQSWVVLRPRRIAQILSVSKVPQAGLLATLEGPPSPPTPPQGFFTAPDDLRMAALGLCKRHDRAWLWTLLQARYPQAAVAIAGILGEPRLRPRFFKGLAEIWRWPTTDPAHASTLDFLAGALRWPPGATAGLATAFVATALNAHPQWCSLSAWNAFLARFPERSQAFDADICKAASLRRLLTTLRTHRPAFDQQAWMEGLARRLHKVPPLAPPSPALYPHLCAAHARVALECAATRPRSRRHA